jgi:plastocyanin
MQRWYWMACMAAIAAAGCDDGTQVSPTPTSVVPDGSSGGALTVEVGPNGGIGFTPAQITINSGDTVTWQWPAGSLPHTVTSGVPGAPDGKFCSLPDGQMPSVQSCSGAAYAMTGPATYAHTFTVAGAYPYFCQVHGAMMTGMVTVRASSSTSGGTTSTSGGTSGGTTTGGTSGGTTTGGTTTGGSTTGHY